MKASTAILTAHCPDREGLVAALTQWILERGGNLLHLDQHVDPEQQHFFVRIQWDLARFEVSREALRQRFGEEIGDPLKLDWEVTLSGQRPRMALFVSKLGHCFWDILGRCEISEWDVEVPLIISNHETYADAARKLGYAFHVLPITPETKREQERKQLALLQEHRIDLVVLARYMQVVTDELVAPYRNRIINIHHSFLPAFAGARPYHRAYERGVKVIGASAHYVTTELDEGPIIEQDTVGVSHRDGVADMIRKGRDLEKVVLARAIYLHLNRQVIVHGNRTVVFA